MIQLTPEQRESLATLNEADHGLYESSSLPDRLLIGRRRIIHLCHEYGSGDLRVLVVAPANRLKTWQEELRINGNEPQVIGGHKGDPAAWRDGLGKGLHGGDYLISWESMRGSIPAGRRRVATKTSKREALAAMRAGTIPPWTETGVWDLVIADNSQHLAFRNTLQRQVMQTIESRHRLALSDNATGSHPEGLWGTLNWLWPDRYPNYWNWLNTCFNVDYIKNSKFTRTEILGEKMPGSSWFDVPCAVRKTP